MSTYKMITSPAAEWIVVNGVVGTAHYSQRHEGYVDFRPATHVATYHGYTYQPSRGVQCEALYVNYRSIVSIDYRAGTWTLSKPEARTKSAISITVVGLLPEMATVNRPSSWRYEEPGFPAPEDVKAEWAAWEAEHWRKQTENPTDAQFEAWAESLTGLERRWMQRWLTTGKAEAQMIAAALAAFPQSNTAKLSSAAMRFRYAWEQQVTA